MDVTANRVVSASLLILTACMWLYFVCHSVIEFQSHLEHERRVLQEAKILATTVCEMSREDIAGAIIDCESARATAMHHSPCIKALEKTMSTVVTEMFFIATEGVRGASHALGLVGCIGFLVMYVISLFFRAILSTSSTYSAMYNPHPMSQSLRQKHESSVTILPIDDD